MTKSGNITRKGLTAAALLGALAGGTGAAVAGHAAGSTHQVIVQAVTGNPGCIRLQRPWVAAHGPHGTEWQIAGPAVCAS